MATSKGILTFTWKNTLYSIRLFRDYSKAACTSTLLGLLLASSGPSLVNFTSSRFLYPKIMCMNLFAWPLTKDEWNDEMKESRLLSFASWFAFSFLSNPLYPSIHLKVHCIKVGQSSDCQVLFPYEFRRYGDGIGRLGDLALKWWPDHPKKC